MNSELGENGKDTVVLDWFRPPESKPLRPCGGIMREERSPIEWSSRSPYMAGGLGFPFEVDGPSSGTVTYFRNIAFHNYREDPAIPGSTGATAAMI
jgi:hypothetical protein